MAVLRLDRFTTRRADTAPSHARARATFSFTDGIAVESAAVADA